MQFILIVLNVESVNKKNQAIGCNSKTASVYTFTHNRNNDDSSDKDDHCITIQCVMNKSNAQC